MKCPIYLGGEGPSPRAGGARQVGSPCPGPSGHGGCFLGFAISLGKDDPILEGVEILKGRPISPFSQKIAEFILKRLQSLECSFSDSYPNEEGPGKPTEAGGHACQHWGQEKHPRQGLGTLSAVTRQGIGGGLLCHSPHPFLL